jgi:chromosome segregation ATPase
MIKNFILAFAVIGMMWGCKNEEREQALQTQIDSLRTELKSSEETAQSLQDVGVLIDSIDANRQLLRTDMVEGTSYGNYKERLQSINSYIKETQGKLTELEKNAKNSKIYAGTIKKLRADLQARTQQIAMLEEEVQKIRTENKSLSRTVSQRDSVITINSETIKVREESLAAMENRVQEMNSQFKTDQADLYFAQAQALEKAAQRTKFAPRKKKDTQREALELYKMSLSLGKTEAQAKVEELEKDLG